ncbi:MAG: HAD-IIIA family hydrolase [Planctomycetota bacterium]
MRPAVFLDRDGTINEERHFVRDPEGLELLPGARDALLRLREAGHSLVVVTNQSGIARGYLDQARLARLHERLQVLCGLRFDGLFHCPHHPDAEPKDGSVTGYRRSCDCRKPAPGLIHRAAALLDLDLSKSVMIGDSARDIESGAALGIPGILVRTGKPIETQQDRLAAVGIEPMAVCDDLRDATAYWLARRDERSQA